jgi:hypothetical protein
MTRGRHRHADSAVLVRGVWASGCCDDPGDRSPRQMAASGRLVGVRSDRSCRKSLVGVVAAAPARRCGGNFRIRHRAVLDEGQYQTAKIADPRLLRILSGAPLGAAFI